MTLSPTYVFWCPTDDFEFSSFEFSSVQFRHKLIYQHNLEKSFESWQWISKPQGKKPALVYTFPVHFLYITHLPWFSVKSPGLWNILFDVGQSYSSFGHQFTRLGQTVNLSFTEVGQNVRWFPLYVGQFHKWVGQCPWPTNILRPDCWQTSKMFTIAKK
jgi:hypothetical protein